MGTLVGHVAPGAGFFLIGLWQLINHIRLYCRTPSTYAAPVWFPLRHRRLRHTELILIIVGSSLSIAAELFIGPAKHQPLDADGTIPTDHLHNFEHASISLALLLYAAFTLHFDIAGGVRNGHLLSHLLAAAAFSQQLLIFHLHSADHMGMEGQYHRLLQYVISVTLTGTVLAAGYPKSFAVAFIRSVSLVFQGVWFVVMGVMLWTPGFLPKGCFLNFEDGHDVARCDGDAALARAKALINLQFSWYLSATLVGVVVLYLWLSRRWPEEGRYLPVSGKSGGVGAVFELEDGDEDDVEKGAAGEEVPLKAMPATTR